MNLFLNTPTSNPPQTDAWRSFYQDIEPDMPEWSWQSFFSLTNSYEFLVLSQTQKNRTQANQLLSVLAYRTHDNETDILFLATHSDYRRQGLSKKLLEALLARAKPHGKSRFFLEVRASNQAALLLYRSMGFQMIGERKDYYAPLAKGASREKAYCLAREDDKRNELG